MQVGKSTFKMEPDSLENHVTQNWSPGEYKSDHPVAAVIYELPLEVKDAIGD
jgi:hypothetical protein